MNSKVTVIAVLLAILGLLALAPAPATAGDSGAKIKDIVESNVPSIVEITAMQTQSLGDQSQEVMVSARGTVIDAENGIIVTAMSSLDAGGSRPIGRGMIVTITIDPNSIKIITADGTSHDGEILAQDKQLDLSFIKVKPEEDKPFSAEQLALDNQGTAGLGDKVYAVSRSLKDFDYTPTYWDGRITTVVEKPRHFYIARALSVNGCPVFNDEGQLIGLMTNYVTNDEGASSADAAGVGMFALILPIDEVTNALALTMATVEEEEEE